MKSAAFACDTSFSFFLTLTIGQMSAKMRFP